LGYGLRAGVEAEGSARFTSNRKEAESYGDVVYVDILKSEVGKYYKGGVPPREWFKLPREIAKSAKPIMEKIRKAVSTPVEETETKTPYDALKDYTIETEAEVAETGKTVKLKRNAKEEYDESARKRDAYQKMLECLAA
jgi:hypothetical protein